MTVIVAGHLCLDIIPNLAGITAEAFERSFTPGHLVECGPAGLSTGGAVSNVGLALHRLGIPTRLMGKIGDDLVRAGRAADHRARRPRPGRRHDRRSARPQPPIPSSSTRRQVDRIFLHYPGANDTFTAADVRYDVWPQARSSFTSAIRL